MLKISLALAAVLALTACTTTEKDMTIGTVAGAAIGGIANGGKGALIGAAAGAGTGFLVRKLRNGQCEYRDRNGNMYTASCKR